MTSRDYWAAVAEGLGLEPRPEVVAALGAAYGAGAWAWLDATVLALAARLRRDVGMRVGLLSNSAPEHETHIPAFEAVFDVALFSHRTGRRKPAAATYLAAAEALGVAPGAVVFVDDKERNVAAAHGGGHDGPRLRRRRGVGGEPGRAGAAAGRVVGRRTVTQAFQLVDDPAEWPAVAEQLRAVPRMALDLEADGYHRYPERLSLCQLALPDGSVFLVDPLAVTDLGELGAALAHPGVTTVLHSADYDLRMLDRHLGFHIHSLFDTSIAAQLCGSRRLGLANVLTEHLDITLPKSRRLQTLDWSRRPLPADALAYAAGDVVHLLALADHLAARLAELGRTEWVAEECERLTQVRYVPPEPPEQAFLATPGARDLSPRDLAVLRELYVFRDGEALRIGRPPHHVMSNAAMVALAAEPRADLRRIQGLGRWVMGGEVRTRLRDALARGQASEPVQLPRRRGENPWTNELRARLSQLKRWRTGEAERLELDPGVVWPAAHLDQVALHPRRPSVALDQGEPPWVRDWQWQVLGPSLEHFRTSQLDDVPVAMSPTVSASPAACCGYWEQRAKSSQPGG